MSVLDGLTINDSGRVRRMVDQAAFEATGQAMREDAGRTQATVTLKDGRTARVTVLVHLETWP